MLGRLLWGRKVNAYSTSERPPSRDTPLTRCAMQWCVCMYVLACTQVAYSTPRSKHRRGNVFIGNLKPWVTTAVLKQLMEKHGTLLDCRVLTGALITAVACRAVCRPHTDGTALLTLVCWLLLWGCADARGMSKGIGFARFEYTKSATAAIDDYHNKVLCAQRPVAQLCP